MSQKGIDSNFYCATISPKQPLLPSKFLATSEGDFALHILDDTCIAHLPDEGQNKALTIIGKFCGPRKTVCMTESASAFRHAKIITWIGNGLPAGHFQSKPLRAAR